MSKPTAAASAATLGVALATVSAFLPWVVGHTTAVSVTVVPATQAPLRGGMAIELAALAGGLALMLTRRQPALLGAAGSLWFNVSIVTWLVGGRVAASLPDVLPQEGEVVELGPGASVGALAGLLIMCSVVMVLVEDTWHWPVAPPPLWFAALGLLVAIATMAVRSVTWISLSLSTHVTWQLGLDSLPLIGDAFGVMLVVGAAAIVVCSVFPRQWLALAVTSIGVVILATGAVSLASASLLDRGATWVMERAFSTGDLAASAESGTGPAIACAVGVLIMAFGIATVWMLNHRVHRPRTHSAGETPAVPTMQSTSELPF